jgi:hypothetical protein
MSIENLYPARVWGIKWVGRSSGLLLYSPYAFRLFTLNRTSASIWLLSNGQSSAGEIVDKIAATLAAASGPVSDERALRAELIEGVDQLAQQGLITLLQAPTCVEPESLKLLPSNYGMIQHRTWSGWQHENTTSR